MQNPFHRNCTIAPANRSNLKLRNKDNTSHPMSPSARNSAARHTYMHFSSHLALALNSFSVAMSDLHRTETPAKTGTRRSVRDTKNTIPLNLGKRTKNIFDRGAQHTLVNLRLAFE